MAVPEPGSFAPDFELPKDGGGTVRLSSLRGRPVVLYFYPKDDTSGCTTEALDFTARKSDFDALGAVILGVSPDSVKKHDKFKAKHGLTIDLLSDEEKQVVQQYGLWIEKSLYGRKYMGVERSTFLIDPEGKIVTSWIKVKIPGHVDAVLEALKKLLQSVT
ncbi:peroxiredoxin [bacterium SGD-2]|nr:peroxiredoxin [bacterium SGD-2]